MKKATELKNWFSAWWERQIKKESVNLKENEESIIALLTWCNGSRLTTEESIVLFNTIQSKFNNRISRDKVSMTRTLIAINDYEGREPIKSVVKNTDFDKTLAEMNVDYEFVKKD